MSELFTLRPGVSFNIHPESKPSFTNFRELVHDQVAEMDRFLAETQECKSLLDAGAAQGVFSLAFAARGGGALAVEPSIRSTPILEYNIQANNDLDIGMASCALSDISGIDTMWHYGGFLYFTPHVKYDNEAIEVYKNTGDALCKERGFRPDVIKIDVEGHEVRVLKGLQETIRRFKPIIFLEVHIREVLLHGDKTVDLDSYFEDYTIERISGEKMTSLGDLEEGRLHWFLLKPL